MIHERPIPGGGEPEKERVGAVADEAGEDEAGEDEAAGGETPGGGGRRGRDGRHGGRAEDGCCRGSKS